MKPVVTKRKMSEYNARRRADLCKCGTLCEDVILMVQDEFVHSVCTGGALQFANEVLKVAGMLSELTPVVAAVWTTKQESAVRAFVQGLGNGRVPRGGYAELAKAIGKDSRVIKHKVQSLRRAGKLKALKK